MATELLKTNPANPTASSLEFTLMVVHRRDNAGGWCLEQAWAREGTFLSWAPALKVAINITMENWPPYAIVDGIIAYDEALLAIVSAAGAESGAKEPAALS